MVQSSPSALYSAASAACLLTSALVVAARPPRVARGAGGIRAALDAPIRNQRRPRLLRVGSERLAVHRFLVDRRAVGWCRGPALEGSTRPAAVWTPGAPNRARLHLGRTAARSVPRFRSGWRIGRPGSIRGPGPSARPPRLVVDRGSRRSRMAAGDVPAKRPPSAARRRALVPRKAPPVVRCQRPQVPGGAQPPPLVGHTSPRPFLARASVRRCHCRCRRCGWLATPTLVPTSRSHAPAATVAGELATLALHVDGDRYRSHHPRLQGPTMPPDESDCLCARVTNV